MVRRYSRGWGSKSIVAVRDPHRGNRTCKDVSDNDAVLLTG